MGGLIRLLENRTALLFFCAALLIAGAAFGGTYAAGRIAGSSAAAEASDGLLAAAGQLAEETGLTDEQIASALTSRRAEYIAAGERVLSEYGYRAGSGRGAEYLRSGSLLPGTAAAAGVLCCAAAGLICLWRIFKNERSLTRSAEAAKKPEGHFSDRDTDLLAEALRRLAEQRQESLARLSEDKRSLADYLQDLSHQIKTPASALTLNNEIYRTHPMPHAEQLEYLERDRICIERIDRLCSESLKLARLEAGAVAYRRETVSLRELAEKACAPLYDLAASNGTELSCEIGEGITLEADSLWLCEAVSNLVKNACEHTENGTVTVAAEADPIAVELYITDDGEGIAQSDIPMLFRRFWSKRSERDPSSVGIGMSIAKRITEDMGGRLYIDTEEGRGTQVRLEFLRKL